MKLLPLQQGMIYGPVQSRRLGRSLGINLLPSAYKLCSFDCIYCHYGRTEVKTLSASEHHFPPARDVLEAVRLSLTSRSDFDAVTFSGNGEPTLHPQFPEIAAGVRELRDALAPRVRLVILSNATTAHRPETRDAFARLDDVILKLDAGDERSFACLNRPPAEVTLGRVREGIRATPGAIVQSVFVQGAMGNVDEDTVAAWLEAVQQARPRAVQVYSTDRPVAVTGVERVAPERLQAIADQARARTGLEVTAFWPRT